MKAARAPRKAAKPPGRQRKQSRRANSSALPGTEETWRILEDLPVAVVVATLDENPKVLFINKQFLKTFGYTLAEIPTQEDWARLAYPDAEDRKKVFVRWNAAVARSASIQGSVESMEFRVATKDGRTVDILFSAIVSSRFLELCGLDRKAAEENPFNAFACVHPDDYDEWVRKNAECFEKKIPFSEECRIVVRGETRWILTESVPRDLSDGSIVWEGVLTDITRRKQAEEEATRANQSMQLAAGAAGIGFFSRDIATGLEEWDEQMLRIYGVPRSQFDGRWEPLVHPEDLPRVQALTDEAISRGSSGRYEYRIVRPDGTVRHLRGMSTVICDEQGKPLREIGVNFDITEEKAAAEREKALEETRRRDLENKLRISLSAAAVSHEINQPMSSIILQSNMALRKSGDERQALQLIAGEAQRVVGIIERIKSLMRNTGTAIEPIDLRDIADDAVLYASTFARPAQARITFERSARAAVIEADADQIQIALNNLLRNAIEAMSELPARRPREINVEVRGAKDTLVLVVGDSGRGFPEEATADQLPDSTKPGGTGLGLFIVRTAAENHGARLEIGRSPLGGAEVRIIFPKPANK
jgi:PAS domain S-box-containing protein